MILRISAFAMLATLSACATRPADPIANIQRNLNSPAQCKSAEVRYCSAHGSSAKDGLCTCMKQRDAQSALDNIN
jgi:hypothetical protein